MGAHRVFKAVEDASLAHLSEQAKDLLKQSETSSFDVLKEIIADFPPETLEKILKELTSFTLIQNLLKRPSHSVHEFNKILATETQRLIEIQGPTKALATLCNLKTTYVITGHPNNFQRGAIIRHGMTLLSLLNESSHLHATSTRLSKLILDVETLVRLMYNTPLQRPFPLQTDTERNNILQHLKPLLVTAFDAHTLCLDAIRDCFPPEMRPQLAHALTTQFATWVGGDGDGNPNTTAQVTSDTSLQLRSTVLGQHCTDLTVLAGQITFDHIASPHLETVLARIEALKTDALFLDSNWPPLRQLVVLMAHQQQLLRSATANDSYPLNQFKKDLDLISSCVNDKIELPVLNRLQYNADTFGYHFAKLHYRQNGAVHRNMMGSLLKAAGVHDTFDDLSAKEQNDLLHQYITGSSTAVVPSTYTGEGSMSAGVSSKEFAEKWRALKEIQVRDPDALGDIICAEACSEQDGLILAALGKLFGLNPDTTFTMLLEDGRSLENGPGWIKSLRDSGIPMDGMLAASDSTNGMGTAAAVLQKSEAGRRISANTGQTFSGIGSSPFRLYSEDIFNTLCADNPSAKRYSVTIQHRTALDELCARPVSSLLAARAARQKSKTKHLTHPPSSPNSRIRSDSLARLCEAAHAGSSRQYEHLFAQPIKDFVTYLKEAYIASRPAVRKTGTSPADKNSGDDDVPSMAGIRAIGAAHASDIIALSSRYLVGLGTAFGFLKAPPISSLVSLAFQRHCTENKLDQTLIMDQFLHPKLHAPPDADLQALFQLMESHPIDLSTVDTIFQTPDMPFRIDLNDVLNDSTQANVDRIQSFITAAENPLKYIDQIHSDDPAFRSVCAFYRSLSDLSDSDVAKAHFPSKEGAAMVAKFQRELKIGLAIVNRYLPDPTEFTASPSSPDIASIARAAYFVSKATDNKPSVVGAARLLDAFRPH